MSCHGTIPNYIFYQVIRKARLCGLLGYARLLGPGGPSPACFAPMWITLPDDVERPCRQACCAAANKIDSGLAKVLRIMRQKFHQSLVARATATDSRMLDYTLS